jgi:hypothetical protein
VKTVEAEFLPDEEKDDEAAGHPDGQAEDVDARKDLLTPDVPERDFKIGSPQHLSPLFRFSG